MKPLWLQPKPNLILSSATVSLAHSVFEIPEEYQGEARERMNTDYFQQGICALMEMLSLDELYSSIGLGDINDSAMVTQVAEMRAYLLGDTDEYGQPVQTKSN